MKKVKVEIICRKELLPVYKTNQSAGCDIRADIEYPVRLLPGQSAIIPTGIRIKLPDGYEAQARCRSGLNFKNGIVSFTGTIDADYRGEVKVKIYNLSREEYTIQPMERIAQLVIKQVEQAEWAMVDEFPEEEDNERGVHGFGSTGKD